MPTTIDSAGITFNDATSLTSANIGTAQLVNGSVTAAKLGTTEQKQIAKAWVNFNGTGTIGTDQTIRSSFNVSSVAKTGTGLFTINFPAAGLANSQYAVTFGSIRTNNTGNISGAVTENNLIARTSSSIPIVVTDSSFGPIDPPYVSVVIFAS